MYGRRRGGGGAPPQQYVLERLVTPHVYLIPELLHCSSVTDDLSHIYRMGPHDTTHPSPSLTAHATHSYPTVTSFTQPTPLPQCICRFTHTQAVLKHSPHHTLPPTHLSAIIPCSFLIYIDTFPTSPPLTHLHLASHQHQTPTWLRRSGKAGRGLRIWREELFIMFVTVRMSTFR